MTTSTASTGGRALRLLMAASVATLLAVALTTGGAGAQALPPGGTFSDDDGNTHEGMIEAIAAAGITQGCNEDGTLYCPAQAVTRAQMASFIARGFDVPASSVDAFPDDEGSVHEANINAVAAAGIAAGFDDGTFGPLLPVSRAQMASFLARAMQLDPVSGDRFADVSGVHEGNINAIAEAGVTLGCDDAGTLFCPADPVRRDQMASFIGRALGLDPIEPPPPTSSSTSTTDGSTSTTDGSTSTTDGSTSTTDGSTSTTEDSSTTSTIDD